MRNLHATVLLFACTCSIGQVGAAQERIIDTSRLPYNIADCLIRGWPRPGEWVTYTASFQGAAELAPVGGDANSYIMQSELIPVPKGKNLHWLEVTLRASAKDPPRSIGKLLVDLTDAKADEWNMGRQIIRGWQRLDDHPPGLLTDETFRESAVLGFLIVSLDEPWEREEKTTVEFKSRRLACDTYTLVIKEDEGEVHVKSLLHPSVPFGCVMLEIEMRRDGKAASFKIEISDHGTGARSDLPKHDLNALLDAIAKESVKDRLP